MKQVLYDIQNTHNVNLLRQEDLVVAYLKDLIPSNSKVISRMKLFYESDTHLLIQKYQDSPVDAYAKAVANFVDYAQCDEEIGKQLIEAVFVALKLKWSEQECFCIKIQIPQDSYTLSIEGANYGGAMGAGYWVYAVEHNRTHSKVEYLLYEHGAKDGDADCMVMLAEGYATGVDGVDFMKKDTLKAGEWFLKAADAGHPTALFNLAVMAYNKGDYSRTVDYCTRALNGLEKWPRTNDIQYLLGLCAYHGRGWPQNCKEAAERFMAAMQNKYPSIQNRGQARKYLKKCIQEGGISESTVIARLGSTWSEADK